MWQRLVLAYQPDVWGSCDDRTTMIFGEATMAEPCECVGKAAIVETHKAQEGASGGVKSLDWR
jgi:hypothetical protein